MSGYRGNILVIEHKENIRNSITQRLRKSEYRCYECRDSTEAFKYLASEELDVVLLDSDLCGDSKTNLFEEIITNNQHVEVIIVMDIIKASNAAVFLEQGAYDYIVKPFGIDDIVYSVKRAMEKRTLERTLQTYQQNLKKEAENQNKETHDSFYQTIATLSFALEGKDSYTAGHSRRVSEIAMAIGRRIGLGENELEDLRWGSLLHDLGKIAVNQNIVNKNGKLTSEEYQNLMAHPIIGATILTSVANNRVITEIIEYHHLLYNGSGPNQKIKGCGIPLLARIVTLADAYDAMTSNRPYRSALSHEEALAEIKKESGIRFDPEIVRVFLKMSLPEIVSGKSTILVVDDEECIRLLIRSVLGNEFRILEADNGRDAIKTAQEQKPSLILMDIVMPELSGFDTCYELKNNPATKDVPVILMTGFDKELNRPLSNRMGAAGYITKPFNIMELLDIVKQFLKPYSELTSV